VLWDKLIDEILEMLWDKLIDEILEMPWDKLIDEILETLWMTIYILKIYYCLLRYILRVARD